MVLGFVKAQREVTHLGVHLKLRLAAVDSLLRLALGHLGLDRGGCEYEVVLLALAVAHRRVLDHVPEGLNRDLVAQAHLPVVRVPVDGERLHLRQTPVGRGD